MMVVVNRKNRTKFRDQVLNPMVDAGLVEMTISDKLRSSKQKYKLTDKGRQFGIKVGFVGAGWMGSCQIQRLTERDDAEVVALYEKNAERGKEVLAGSGLSPDILVDDYEKIVNNPEIDAV